MSVKKVILAFSGGLDTSFCVPYLKKKGYQVIALTLDIGGFSKRDLKKKEKKSKKLGAVKHICLDVKNDLFEKIYSYVIKINALYEGSYPHLCADRYIIAEKLIEIAKKEKTKFVAHGCTAMGNDQVRIDVSLACLAPDFKIIAPIREIGGDRKKEQKYLENLGFQIDKAHKKYSISESIAGFTSSGSEIAKLKEPAEQAFSLTKLGKIKPSYIELEFNQGKPIKLNGKTMKGFEILQILNKKAGSYSIGREIYTGDCVIGIKGRIVLETPALTVLLKAHLALEQITLTKYQIKIGRFLSEYFSELLYTGLFYEQAMNDLKAFIDSQQRNASGKVKVKLMPGLALPVEVQTKKSLIDKSIADYAHACVWTAKDAESFIKLYGLQSKIAYLKKESKENVKD